MKILIVGSFGQPMYAPAFLSGFKELGHEVEYVDYEDYIYNDSCVKHFFSRLQTRYHYGLKLYTYNHDILKKAEGLKPDFIFLYRCYNIWPSTIMKLKAMGNFIFTYNNDDPFKSIPSNGYYRYFRANIPLADANFVYRKKNIADYEKVGGRNIKLLLPYFIAKNNYREDCGKDLPLSFIAHFENDGRDRYIKALVDAGLPITVYGGKEWKEAPLWEDIRNVVKPGKRGKEYNHTINRSSICLVLFSGMNNDTYTRRCFEIPAAATLMLSQYTEDMNRMFPADDCAVYFHDEKELVEKAKFLLQHPGEIGRIAENGYRRLQELGGSEIDRCREIVEYYRQLKNGK